VAGNPDRQRTIDAAHCDFAFGWIFYRGSDATLLGRIVENPSWWPQERHLAGRSYTAVTGSLNELSASEYLLLSSLKFGFVQFLNSLIVRDLLVTRKLYKFVFN
jgi:hypothetical protein